MTATESASTQYPDALPIGTTLGEFAISKVIGVGGFGIVYMAHDAMLARTVAIKEYLPITIAGRTGEQTVAVRSMLHHGAYTSGLHSFLREARLQARFSHPAMLEVYRVWEQNGTAYMAMRYYPGSSLRDLRHEPDSSHLFAEASIRQILSPVFDALEELHSQSVLHRDVSPDNILLQPSGAPVLLDFGSARMVVAGAAQSLTTVLKPGYAPIEQYADDGTMVQGPWTDVYGLGAVLHYLAIGSPPPQAVTRMMGGTISAFEDGASARYSASFVAAVTAALAVKPQDRLQSVAALRDALGWGFAPGDELAVETVLAAPDTAVAKLAHDDRPTIVVSTTTSAATDTTPAIRAAQAGQRISAPVELQKAAARRPASHWVVAGSALLLTLAVIAYFGFTPPASQVPSAPTLNTPVEPASAAPSAIPAAPASSTTETNATPASAVPKVPPSVASKTEKRVAPKSANRDAPTLGPPASSSARSRDPQETRQTAALCERLFAKLSLGNAVLTETEQKQLPGCR